MHINKYGHPLGINNLRTAISAKGNDTFSSSKRKVSEHYQLEMEPRGSLPYTCLHLYWLNDVGLVIADKVCQSG